MGETATCGLRGASFGRHGAFLVSPFSYKSRRDMIAMYGISTHAKGSMRVAGDAELGQVLRSLRETRGLSVTSAAQALGTDRHATVSEIESGRRKATFAEVVKLAALYGVGVADVVGGLGDADSNGAARAEVVTALPRADGPIGEDDRLALARLERVAKDYIDLKSVLGS